MHTHDTHALTHIHCAIIGTGAFSALHAQAITASAHLNLSAVCDINEKYAKEFSSEWGGEAYTDLSALLDEKDLDIITIATPDSTHASITNEILDHPNAPKLIIIEKPLCMTSEELKSIKEHADGKDTQIVVDHTRRFNEGFHKVKHLIESGDLGDEVLSVNWRYYAGWFHVGVHAVDTLQMILGRLTCEDAYIKGVDRYEEDPLLDTELNSEKYPEATIFLEGVSEEHYKIFEAEIFLPKGRISIQWEDVFVDRLKPDDEFASLLWFDEHFKVESTEKSLENLYEKSAALLNDNNEEILELAGLSEASSTMQILFDAEEMSEATELEL